MNRIARILCSASLFGALSVAPSLANAQPINVAPPVYPVPAQQSRAYGGYEYNPGYGYNAPRDYAWERDWERDRGRESWAHARREHARMCEHAFEEGAPRWVLERMRCVSY